jgi:shikimate kinase
MDLDYYSYKPLVEPDRPACLVGLPGAEHGKVARMVSLLTGLPLFWLDRAVEHKAGRTIDGVVVKEGQGTRLKWERQLLPDVLKRPTPHVVALSDQTLRDPRLLDLVQATSTLVYIRRPREVIVAEMGRRHAKNQAEFARLLLYCPADAGMLAPALDPLEEPMKLARHVVDAEDLHPRHAADKVIETLGWEVPNLWEGG